MSFCNSVINHNNCDYDTNCGLTCDQVFWREANADPNFVFSQDHYNDFMSMCQQYYFPSGCPDGSDGSSSSNGGGCGLGPETLDSLNQFFLDGFYGGIIFTLPYLSGIFFILLASFLLISSYKHA